MINKNLVFTPVTMHGSQAGMKKDLTFTPVLPEGLASAGHSLRGKGRFTPIWATKVTNIDPNLKYVPSVTGFEGGRGKLEREDESFTLDWWTDTAIFNYNALMVSAFYGMERWDFRDYYKIPRKDFLLVADSGGYQISTQNVKIEPTDILRWMEANVDVGMTLDVPPLDMSLKIVGTLDNFKKGAEQSKRNYEIMYRNWDGKLELLKVIHGANAEWLDYWSKEMEQFEFSGLAFSPKPLTIESVAIVLAYARHFGTKKAHVFLGTGEEITPLLVYAKKFFDRLTFDSSSFSISGARYRSYFLPYKLSQSLEFGGKYNTTLKSLPCSCPVCQLSTIKDLNSEGSLPGGLISLHNLYVYLQHYYFLHNLSDDKEIYKTYLRSQGLEKVNTMIDFLDYSADVGFYDAYKKQFGTGNLDEFFGGS